MVEWCHSDVYSNCSESLTEHKHCPYWICTYLNLFDWFSSVSVHVVSPNVLRCRDTRVQEWKLTVQMSALICHDSGHMIA